MARMPYADLERPDLADVVQQILAERGSVMRLHQMLLHAPGVAEPWVRLLTAIRWRCALPSDLSEMVIMRIAHLNKARYESFQHRPHALKAGVSEEKLAALESDPLSDIFSSREALVLAYCDAMTKSIAVDDALFEKVRAEFSEREVVELTTTVAAYNMVSRFLVALGIVPEDEA